METRGVNGLNAALADRYRVDRQIGVGGMATVYLAHDLKHDRTVAIKVLHEDLARTVGAERFLAEIRTTARLTHPNILPLHDSGEAGGFLFYVMPLVEGESLRDRLTREKRLSVDEAVRLTCEVADALEYAHQHHVVHRDIKPENILLQSGHALVADFGIARAISTADAARITTMGMALGTPAYMSPEQAAGELDVDGRSDLYSLASVLYEMLAGEPPFTGPTVESVIAQRFTRPAPRITLMRASVPRAVEGAISTALARAPEDRFATMARFAAALTSKSAAQSGESDRSIAVLPFVNMSGDPANEFFSDGISEEIINALTQLRELRVAARTSAFSFKGKNVDLRAIGDQLGVSTVLEGSVRQSGNRLRITAQLTNVADGYHLWSERYDRELTDVFAIQDEIANAIATKLKVTVGPNVEQLVKPATDNVDAYSLYLKGRALELQRGPALVMAVECFEQAVALDPEYAPAYAELAKSLLLLSLWGMRHPQETHARASAAATRALEVDPMLDAAHIAEALLAFCVAYDRVKAARAWARAVELDPGDPEARALRALYDFTYARGAFHDAIQQINVALAADPLNVNVRAHLSLMMAWAGQYAEAEDEAQRAIQLGPNVFYARWALVHGRMLGPNPEAAVVAATAMLSAFGRHPWPMMALALASGRAGRHDTAGALYAELDARTRTEYVQPTIRAMAALGAGRRDEVFKNLREAVKLRDPMFALVALYWPGLDPVRADPQFAQILRQMGWDRPFDPSKWPIVNNVSPPSSVSSGPFVSG